MILQGLDKNNNLRRVETKPKHDWWKFEPLDQYYIDGKQVTKEEVVTLLEEIENNDPNFSGYLKKNL